MLRLNIKYPLKFFAALIPLILICLCMPSKAYATCDGSIELPSYFVIKNNGLEDFLYTYLSVLWSEPASLIESWEDADAVTREAYYSKRQKYMDDLIGVYLQTNATVSDIGQWYLNFVKWLDDFQEEIVILKKQAEARALEELRIAQMQAEAKAREELRLSQIRAAQAQAELESPQILATNEVLYQLPQLESQHYTYMPIRAITHRTSRQWAFKPHLTSDEVGFKRYGEAYGIALGQYFGTDIGDIYQITFSDGQVILGVLTDCKAIQDTDPTRRYADARYLFDGTKGNIVEFVMDDELPQFQGLPYNTMVNTINKIIRDRFSGDVIEIRKVGRVDVVF